MQNIHKLSKLHVPVRWSRYKYVWKTSSYDEIYSVFSLYHAHIVAIYCWWTEPWWDWMQNNRRRRATLWVSLQNCQRHFYQSHWHSASSLHQSLHDVTWLCCHQLQHGHTVLFAVKGHLWGVQCRWKVCSYFFGSKEALCVRWIPYTSYANATTVAVANCHSQSRYETCTVGRLVSSLNTVPGKYYDDIQTAWYVLDGVESTNGQIEILDIQDGCQITWIPYNTCDTIPTGAVLGEYLAWKGGIDLYITRGNVYRLNIIGYYNPVDAIGHICLWGKII